MCVAAMSQGFDSSDDESDEEEEDWKDQCDEMAAACKLI